MKIDVRFDKRWRKMNFMSLKICTINDILNFVLLFFCFTGMDENVYKILLAFIDFSNT